MSIFSAFLSNKTAVLDLIKDPRLHDLVTKREFRLTEEYLHREFLAKVTDEELTGLNLSIGEGHAELSGKVKKRLLPFPIPFSARFSIHSTDFSHKGKVVRLKLEEVKPIDLDSLTKKLVEQVPFLTYEGGLVSLDLERVPRLAELFGYQVKGIRPFDFVVLKDLVLSPGEVVGKVGVIL